MRSGRPKGDDHKALDLLCANEDLDTFDAEFLESLLEWRGEWTEKQAAYFDQLCDRLLFEGG